LVIVLAFVACSMAAPSQTSEHGPQTFADCVAMEQKGHSDDKKNSSKMADFKACAQKCISAAGITPNKCFATAKSDAKTFFSGLKSQMQTNKASFLTCIQNQKCQSSPKVWNHTSHMEHSSHSSSPRAYNSSSPRDQKRCAMALLKEAGKPKTEMSSSVKSTLHSCLEACHPASEEEEHSSSQSSGHHMMGRKGRKHHMSCLMRFCAKSDFEACKSSAQESLMKQIQAHEMSEFETTCNCLGGTTCTLSDDACNAAFAAEAKMWADKKAAWEAKHSSSSS